MVKALTLVLSIGTLFSFGGPDSLGVVTDVKEAPQPKELVWNINDSLYHVPAYDLYCGFDQKKIWGVKIDQTKKNDTTAIHLMHDSCDFHSPWVGRLTIMVGETNVPIMEWI